MRWLSVAKWVGTITGVAGAIVIALNLGFVIYGFYLYLISSVQWSIAGMGAARGQLVCASRRIYRHQCPRHLSMAWPLTSTLLTALGFSAVGNPN